MAFKIRNAPQGVSEYADVNACPRFGITTKWGNQFANESMWETKLIWLHAPIWAELGDETVSVPIAIQLCPNPGVSGSVTEIWGEHSNHAPFQIVMDSPGPYTAVGPPVTSPLSGARTPMPVFTGVATFNIADAAKIDTTGLSPLHGWTSVTIKCRTVLMNANQFDTENCIGVYSVIDPSKPEAPLAEVGIPLLGRTKGSIAQNSNVPNGDVWGAHVVEVRDQSLPILAPVSVSFYERVFSYNYGQDPGLTPLTSVDFKYTAQVDGNDDAIPPVPPILLATQQFGGIGNFDSIDALEISGSTPTPGLGANQHMLCLNWRGDTTPSNGVFSPHSQKMIPPGLCVETVMEVIVTSGPSPNAAAPLTLFPVPFLLGMTVAEAETQIVKSGFRVGDVSYNIPGAAGFQPGQVWTQNPAVDPQPLPPGTLIDIGVAVSASVVIPPPALVAVPNVVGMTQAGAQNALTVAGLSSAVVIVAASPGQASGVVLAQSPTAGAQVTPGSVVTINVTGTPPPPPCTKVTPSVVVSPSSQQLAPGQSGSFTVTVTNNDAATCPPRSFTVTAIAQ